MPLEGEDRARAEQEIRNAVGSLAGWDAPLTLIGKYTRAVSADELHEACPQGYSFISVDAGHDAPDVEIDSALAHKVLSAEGVIAFDDVFNPVCPGVMEGLARYMLLKNPDLAPFATCGNKLFACRSDVHSHYYEFSLDLARNAPRKEPGLSRSTEHLQANEALGWSPALFGHEIVAFVWQ